MGRTGRSTRTAGETRRRYGVATTGERRRTLPALGFLITQYSHKKKNTANRTPKKTYVLHEIAVSEEANGVRESRIKKLTARAAGAAGEARRRARLESGRRCVRPHMIV